MNKAIIHFADKSILKVSEGDIITPISSIESIADEKSASMGISIILQNHPSNGLIPSIMDAFINCDFFYFNYDYNIAYNSKAIIRIELA